MLKIQATELIRKTEKEYKENNISKIKEDEKLIEMIAKFPKLMQRPIVTKGNKARIGRPPENILEIL